MIKKLLTVVFVALVSVTFLSAAYAGINAESLKKHLADEKVIEDHIQTMYYN